MPRRRRKEPYVPLDDLSESLLWVKKLHCERAIERLETLTAAKLIEPIKV
jgi:hypothetical protein